MQDVTPSPQNRRRTNPVRALRVADQPLHAETLAADDESEAARGVSSRGQDLAAVMALIPGVRVVMLSSSPAVQDVEHARGLRALGPACEDAKGGTFAGDVPRRRSSTCLSPTRPWAA